MRRQKIYTRFNKIINKKNSFRLPTCNQDEKTKFLSVFNYCLSSLKDEYITILKNCYFENNYEFWWLDYYCKSSFYRKRFWAIISFVRLFELIYENFNVYSAYHSFTFE